MHYISILSEIETNGPDCISYRNKNNQFNHSSAKIIMILHFYITDISSTRIFVHFIFREITSSLKCFVPENPEIVVLS